MDDTTNIFLNPVIQYGFAGFAVVLLGIVVWMFKVVKDVVSANTEAMTRLITSIESGAERSEQILRSCDEVKTLLLTRQCVARKE